MGVLEQAVGPLFRFFVLLLFLFLEIPFVVYEAALSHHKFILLNIVNFEILLAGQTPIQPTVFVNILSFQIKYLEEMLAFSLTSLSQPYKIALDLPFRVR